MIKHRILKELYSHQMNLKTEVCEEWEDFALRFEELQLKIRCNKEDFYSALEVLSANEEVDVEWEDKMALLLSKGAASFGDKKYHYEHKKRSREKILFWTKMIGVVAVVLSIILGVLKITKEYKSAFPEENQSER